MERFVIWNMVSSALLLFRAVHLFYTNLRKTKMENHSNQFPFKLGNPNDKVLSLCCLFVASVCSEGVIKNAV